MSCCGGSCGCSHDDTTTVVKDTMNDGCCGGGCCSHDDAMQVELTPEQIELLSRLLDENNEEDLTDEQIEQIRAILFAQQS